MSFECTYCSAELIYEDAWGIGAHWIRDNNPEGGKSTVAQIMDNLKMSKKL